MLRERFDISKMTGNKLTSRIIERISKERFSANTEKAAEEIGYEIKFLHE